ncbi:conserved hypothetical protein [Aeromonas salmonicida]|nr:conserved hypothetical protein [Aeromonas salmonicida]
MIETHHGRTQNDRAVSDHCGGRNRRLLSALSLADTGPKCLAAAASGFESGAVCLAAFTASDRCWPCLCRLWWCLYLCRHPLALAGGRYQTHTLGAGGFAGGAARHGHHHVCTKARLESGVTLRREQDQEDPHGGDQNVQSTRRSGFADPLSGAEAP